MKWFSSDGKLLVPPPARLVVDDTVKYAPEDLSKAEETLSTSTWNGVHKLKKVLLVALSISRLKMPSDPLTIAIKVN